MTDEVKTSGAAQARALLDQTGAPESDYRLDWVSCQRDPRLVRRDRVHQRMIPEPRGRMIPYPVRALPLAPRILPALSRHVPLAPRIFHGAGPHE